MEKNPEFIYNDEVARILKTEHKDVFDKACESYKIKIEKPIDEFLIPVVASIVGDYLVPVLGYDDTDNQMEVE